MGITFAAMVAGVFSLASGLSGGLDAQDGQPVLSSQPSTISVGVSTPAIHLPPILIPHCAFCSGLGI